ncbi:nucleotidyltransferase domain-containing protein [Virgibacillus sp. L01]|uniref:nucleotidyltransferase domain-containing protein n=1 Tax=Virgibacillus sp. L01 TaxID=3457429 RepID=UPI003FD0AA84
MDLRILASEIANIYQQNPKVEAVLLGGSVSRNWHDEHSDIELFVFWKGAPTDEERKAPIIELNGNIIDFHPYEDEEWSETYITQGVKLEISNFLTETINKVISDVIISYDTDLDKQCIAATVYNGGTLSGDLVINSMKEKVSKYPYELSVAMVKENIFLGNRWNNREALFERKDWLMLYKVIVSVQTNLMGKIDVIRKKHLILLHYRVQLLRKQ